MKIRNQRLIRLLYGAALLGLALLLAGCSAKDPQNTLSGTQGHVANVLADLFNKVFYLAVLPVFVLVEGLLIFMLIRYRDRGGRVLPVQIHGNTRLEIGWTLAPTLLLAIVAVPTLATLIHVNHTPADAMQVDVIGHQWWWEFQYPDEKITTADELHIPAGRAVRVRLHSNDVVHGFWVPKLAGKTEVIPNHENGMWFSAANPGTFFAQCTEFCGDQHALMQFRVVAESKENFDAWVQSQKQNPPESSSAGAQVFLKGPCVACHTIDGTAAKGNIGPNLTHFGNRAWFEEMQNNPENVAKWLRDPQAIKSGNKMPNYHLSEQDIQSLATWLESLK